MAQKRVLITVGGTGGHLFPAIALAEELKKECDLLFVGHGLSKNRCFDQGAFSFQEVPSGFFPLKRPHHCIKSLGKVAVGTAKSFQILKRYRPDVVVGFGSYHTLPLLLAASLSRVPFILHESNSVAGGVNRLFSPYAAFVGVQFEEAMESLSGRQVLADMPLRERGLPPTKEEARERYKLAVDKPTLLVFGGSQGAQAINSAVLEAFTSGSKMQLLHLTGNLEMEKKLEEGYRKSGIQATVKSFEKEMHYAWAAADIALARAGAGTIAEAVEYEVPLLLIPYPHAAKGHQEKNSRVMVETIGGGRSLLQEALTAKRLTEELDELFSDKEKCQQAMRYYKSRRERQPFSSLIYQFINRDITKEKRR